MAKLSFGAFYFSTPAATTLAAATPAKAAGTTTALQVGGFTHTDNRLTYAETTTRDFLITIMCVVQKAAGSDSEITIHAAKNGTEITGISTTYDQTPHLMLDEAGAVVGDTIPVTLAVMGTVSLANGDYIELFVETDTGDDLTVNEGQVMIKVAG